MPVLLCSPQDPKWKAHREHRKLVREFVDMAIPAMVQALSELAEEAHAKQDSEEADNGHDQS